MLVGDPMFGCHYNPARRPRTATACLARLCVALAALVPLGSVWSVPSATAQTRPNIVLVLTDDLDRAITTARPPVMPNLTQLIQNWYPYFTRVNGERSTVAVWLANGGYRTALFGKYINRYPESVTSTY